MARSLAERIGAHEQHKARLAEQEAKLKDAERKVRTRRLIQAGGLVDKAGLLDLDSNALYGALLSLRDGLDDPEQVARWSTLGGRAFAREAHLEDEGKEAIILAFPTALARDTTTALRAAGFRFNKLLQHWEAAPGSPTPKPSPRPMAATSGAPPSRSRPPPRLSRWRNKAGKSLACERDRLHQPQTTSTPNLTAAECGQEMPHGAANAVNPARFGRFAPCQLHAPSGPPSAGV